MVGIDSLVADSEKRLDRLENLEHQQPLKITAYPNDVIVYYSTYAVVYHAEGSGNSRYNVSEAVYNFSTEIQGDMTSAPEFTEPETVSEEIRIPIEDPYYLPIGGV